MTAPAVEHILDLYSMYMRTLYCAELRSQKVRDFAEWFETTDTIETDLLFDAARRPTNLADPTTTSQTVVS